MHMLQVERVVQMHVRLKESLEVMREATEAMRAELSAASAAIEQLQAEGGGIVKAKVAEVKERARRERTSP